jgi:hypothetical protein
MTHNDSAETPSHPHPEPEHTVHLDLDIRATNNADWEAKQFKDDDQVGEVAKKALEHFVDQKVMSPGDYAIALEVDGNDDFRNCRTPRSPVVARRSQIVRTSSEVGVRGGGWSAT